MSWALGWEVKALPQSAGRVSGLSVAEDCPRPGVQRAVRSLEDLGKVEQVHLGLGFEPVGASQWEDSCPASRGQFWLALWEGSVGPGTQVASSPCSQKSLWPCLPLAPGRPGASPGEPGRGIWSSQPACLQGLEEYLRGREFRPPLILDEATARELQP